MLRFCKFSSIVAALVLTTKAPVSAENWEFREDLGGWYDVESGLVWGEVSKAWNNSWFDWRSANTVGVSEYRQLTGNPNWRMPSLAEWQTAMSHNAAAYFSQTTDYVGLFWTSTEVVGKNKKDLKAWRIKNIFNGTVELVAESGSYGIFILVYRP
jgi:hypothetical protein